MTDLYLSLLSSSSQKAFEVTNESLEKTVKGLVKLMTAEEIGHSGLREESKGTHKALYQLSLYRAAFPVINIHWASLLFKRFCAQLWV